MVSWAVVMQILSQFFDYKPFYYNVNLCPEITCCFPKVSPQKQIAAYSVGGYLDMPVVSWPVVEKILCRPADYKSHLLKCKYSNQMPRPEVSVLPINKELKYGFPNIKNLVLEFRIR